MFLAAYREKYRIKRDIDETNLEILKVVQDMKGLSHHGIEMTPEQMRSSLPMPTATSPSTGDERMLWLIEKKDAGLADLQSAAIRKSQPSVSGRPGHAARSVSHVQIPG